MNVPSMYAFHYFVYVSGYNQISCRGFTFSVCNIERRAFKLNFCHVSLTWLDLIYASLLRSDHKAQSNWLGQETVTRSSDPCKAETKSARLQQWGKSYLRAQTFCSQPHKHGELRERSLKGTQAPTLISSLQRWIASWLTRETFF